MQEELVDRFGRPPEPAQALVACHRLRLDAKPLGVFKIDAGPERSTLHFVKEPPFDAGKLIQLVQKDGRIRFAGSDRIRIERAAPTPAGARRAGARVPGAAGLAAMPARRFPPQLVVFVRDWLSANNILLKSRDGHVLIDTGYSRHAPLTQALLASARGIGAEPLAWIVNTHCHSDHIGGNAAIARRYDCPIAVPEGEALLIERWDQKALLYDYCDQQADRFRVNQSLISNTSHIWGDLEWRAIAAPGHDMGALVFYNPEHRILISGDALWEHGFGIVMPPEIDHEALPATRATLEAIARLDVLVVIPGHGEPFVDVAAALERAFRRVEAFEADPMRMARSVAKGAADVHAARPATAAARRPPGLPRSHRRSTATSTGVSSGCRPRPSRRGSSGNSRRPVRSELTPDLRSRRREPRFEWGATPRCGTPFCGGHRGTLTPGIGRISRISLFVLDIVLPAPAAASAGDRPADAPFVRNPPMQELLDHPAVQGGVAPLVVALIVAAALARTRFAWLAIVAGYATMIALSTGFSFSPLTCAAKGDAARPRRAVRRHGRRLGVRSGRDSSHRRSPPPAAD